MSVTTPPANDHIHTRLPGTEYERRWSLLRTMLAERGLPALVVLGSDDFLGGYVRWLGDRPAFHSYHIAAIFHADGPMTWIEHGALAGSRDVSADPDFFGIGELRTTAAWRSINYTHRYEAELVVDVLRARGYRRIGVIAPGAMPHGFLEYVSAQCDEVVDCTDAVDLLKARKSNLELEQIRATAAMQDRVFERTLAQVEAGMRDQDVMAIAQHEGHRLGSEQGVFLVGSQALGRPAVLRMPHYQGRRIDRGDHFSILIENNGPAGFYCEVGRTVALGTPPAALREAHEKTCAAQRNLVSLLKPGARCADVAAAHDDYMRSAGLPPENRVCAHGQGYDLLERPLIRADEPMTIEAGMVFVAHPGFFGREAFGFICDNYLVRADGPADALHATPQDIFER